jgi:hypothetical protein
MEHAAEGCAIARRAVNRFARASVPRLVARIPAAQYPFV